jgi:hypothetical protein
MVARWPAVAALFLFAAGTPVAPADTIDPFLKIVLTRDLKFSQADFADLVRGRTIRHTLDAGAPGEVAAVGATWIGASVPAFLEQFRDIVNFKRNDGVMQIGRFSNPPTAEDLAALTIDEDDFDAPRCHIGDCAVRLPADDILRFQHGFDWHAPDAKPRAAVLLKDMILSDVRAYWFGTPGRMVQYDDGKRPILPEREFTGILANSPYIGELVPGLPAHLRDFPASRLEGAEDFMYWSKERFGIAPFITVTHVTIAHAASGPIVISSKDVYSSRYFDSSLGLTIVAETPGRGFDLVYVNRSRANALKGAFSAFRKMTVERRVRASLEQSLQTLKSRLEHGS